MTSNEDDFEIGVYLRGRSLNPDHISRILSLKPNDSQKTGVKKVLSSGVTMTSRLGVWCVYEDKNDLPLDSAVASLLSKFPQIRLDILDGVEDAYLHILLLKDGNGERTITTDFGLSREVIGTLSRLGLETTFAIGTNFD